MSWVMENLRLASPWNGCCCSRQSKPTANGPDAREARLNRASALPRLFRQAVFRLTSNRKGV
jgi:hypothetical protein